MLSPALTFGLLIGAFCGALAHLILGGGGRALLSYIVAAWIGFALGQAVGDVMGSQLLVVGTINMLTGVSGAWIAVGIMAILSWQRKPQGSPRRPD